MVHSLYVRGCHYMISNNSGTHYNARHPIKRITATKMYMHRLRHYRDLEVVADEASAVVDKKTLLEL